MNSFTIMWWKFVIALAQTLLVSALSIKTTSTKKVVIAGAGSSVGYLVFQKLFQRSDEFQPIGIVSNREGYDALRRIGAKPQQIHICDITKRKSLHRIFNDAEKAVICSTATPKKKLVYRLKNTLRWLVGKSRPPRPEELYYGRNRRPYDIDYVGHKNIIDECVENQVDHVVSLGYMGGYRGSKLNDIGRRVNDKDIRNGHIIKWKQAAERYLMKRRFFTIIHAGMLTDDKGGQHETVWDSDDALLRTPYKTISREDAAECIVQALIWKEAIGRSIDIASGPSTKPTKDWLRFWARPGNCLYPPTIDGFPME